MPELKKTTLSEVKGALTAVERSINEAELVIKGAITPEEGGEEEDIIVGNVLSALLNLEAKDNLETAVSYAETVYSQFIESEKETSKKGAFLPIAEHLKDLSKRAKMVIDKFNLLTPGYIEESRAGEGLPPAADTKLPAISATESVVPSTPMVAELPSLEDLQKRFAKLREVGGIAEKPEIEAAPSLEDLQKRFARLRAAGMVSPSAELPSPSGDGSHTATLLIRRASSTHDGKGL